MIFSCPAKPFPKLLEFTFQNGAGSVVHGPYFAEEGMDFSDWVVSPHNVDGFKLVDSLKGLTAQPPPYLVTSDEQFYLTVTVNTQIIDGEVYVIAMNM